MLAPSIRILVQNTLKWYLLPVPRKPVHDNSHVLQIRIRKWTRKWINLESSNDLAGFPCIQHELLTIFRRIAMPPHSFEFVSSCILHAKKFWGHRKRTRTMVDYLDSNSQAHRKKTTRYRCFDPVCFSKPILVLTTSTGPRVMWPVAPARITARKQEHCQYHRKYSFHGDFNPCFQDATETPTCSANAFLADTVSTRRVNLG